MPKSILIADDKSSMRSILTGFLGQRPDLEICGEAADGFEAVEKAKVLKPDLVLLDVSMPRMTGIEAASILKKQMPSTAIILFTMYSDNIRASLRSALGVSAVLAKPDGLTALSKAIDAVFSEACSPGAAPSV
jgi:DNA-binding NarL/FixJ family response regulator